jgi:hypothetical protein
MMFYFHRIQLSHCFAGGSGMYGMVVKYCVNPILCSFLKKGNLFSLIKFEAYRVFILESFMISEEIRAVV